MKKTILFTVSLVFIASFVQAQISKGSVLLGGNLSATTNKYENPDNSNNNFHQKGLSVSPSIGIATSDNIIWGLNLGYNYYKNKLTGTTNPDKNNSYSAGIFFRKYVTLGKGFYLFGQANAGYNQYKQQNYYLNTMSIERKGWGINVSAAPGIAYAVSKRFYLEASLNDLLNLGYSHTNETTTNAGQKNTATTNGFSLSTNLNNANPLSIGFRFVLAK